LCLRHLITQIQNFPICVSTVSLGGNVNVFGVSSKKECV